MCTRFLYNCSLADEKTLWSTQEGFFAFFIFIYIRKISKFVLIDVYTISLQLFLRGWDISFVGRKKRMERSNPRSTGENTVARKYPHTSPLPFEEYPRRACEHAGDEEIYLRIPFPPPLPPPPSPPASGNERMEKGSLLQEAEGHTSFWVASRKRAPTRGGAVCFFFISLGEI